MSEWLGKARVEKEDLDKDFPSLNKYFPMLGKYFIENQRLRIVLPLDFKVAEEFKKAVKKKYGKITPISIRCSASEAISDWISKILK